MSLDATLVDYLGNPIDSAEINFNVAGVCSGSAITDTLGVANFNCGPINAPAGEYTIKVQFAGDKNSYLLESSTQGSLVVSQENASMTSGKDSPVAVEVAEPGGENPEFALFVDVNESRPDLPEGLGEPGDISLIEISMTLVPVGPGESVVGICATVGIDGAGYDATLNVQCDFEGVPVNAYTVETSVRGEYYTGYFEDVLVIYDSSLGFTTGGGWFYWPGTEDKTNFGYTMKYKKVGGNVRGNFLLIRHMPDGAIYRIKSNALYGLAIGIGDNYGWASFSGKATYLEPAWIEPVGNNSFIVYVEDHGQYSDQVWIEIHDKDGNIIAAISFDREAVDNHVPIEGGNIVGPH